MAAQALHANMPLMPCIPQKGCLKYYTHGVISSTVCKHAAVHCYVQPIDICQMFGWFDTYAKVACSKLIRSNYMTQQAVAGAAHSCLRGPLHQLPGTSLSANASWMLTTPWLAMSRSLGWLYKLLMSSSL